MAFIHLRREIHRRNSPDNRNGCLNSYLLRLDRPPLQLKSMKTSNCIFAALGFTSLQASFFLIAGSFFPLLNAALIAAFVLYFFYKGLVVEDNLQTA